MTKREFDYFRNKPQNIKSIHSYNKCYDKLKVIEVYGMPNLMCSVNIEFIFINDYVVVSDYGECNEITLLKINRRDIKKIVVEK